MSKFSPGDVVVLKSGSPKMTVSDVGDYSPTGPLKGVAAVWFDGTKKLESVFDEATLKAPE